MRCICGLSDADNLIPIGKYCMSRLIPRSTLCGWEKAGLIQLVKIRGLLYIDAEAADRALMDRILTLRVR